jgi:hypothetical protein
LNWTRIAGSPTKCLRAIDGAARIAARRAIFKSTTSAREAGLGMTPKKTSSRFARLATEPDTYAAKSLGYFEEGIADVIGRRSVQLRHNCERTEWRRSFRT